MSDCLFCKIASADIKADVVYSDDQVIAFRDINSQAPTHILIIPRRHIPTINDLQEEDASLVGHMILIAQRIAKDNQLAEAGYRLVFNCNEDGGQEVFHIHLHLLAGRAMQWPPG